MKTDIYMYMYIYVASSGLQSFRLAVQSALLVAQAVRPILSYSLDAETSSYGDVASRFVFRSQGERLPRRTYSCIDLRAN